MTQLNQTIGVRTYWQGYEAPSTAFVTTDQVQLSLGQLTENISLKEYQDLPELFDLLVTINCIPTQDNPTITLDNKTVPVFTGRLSDYRFSALSLVPQNLIRVKGIIRQCNMSGYAISEFDFVTLKNSIVLGDATDQLKLGGFWKAGCDLDQVRQYSITFYEADDEIRYRLSPEILYLDHIRDHQVFLNLVGEDATQDFVNYESIDMQRHGSCSAWVTFRRHQ